MDKLFTKPQEFRVKANDNDYKDLYYYFYGTTMKDWETEDCPYGFSRVSAFTLLKEKDMIKKKGKETGLDINFSKLNTKKRSFHLTDEVWERIQCLYKNYESVDKQNVIDAFLRKALDDMGV